MEKTVVFITNQFSCDRIIQAAREVADQTETQLVILSFLDSEYDLNPQAIEYLYDRAKKSRASATFLFSPNRLEHMTKTVGQFDSVNIITGMPGGSESVLYKLWEQFPEKSFFIVDAEGCLTPVSTQLKRKSAG
ncbi:hypothetical protein U6B65_07265 [Oscillospiraceae bacterium MB08-C2-2]|nr:hypothetical protein U6B65_07265 [Oscillospiraceae bacterium MB08-C2-2]